MRPGLAVCDMPAEVTQPGCPLDYGTACSDVHKCCRPITLSRWGACGAASCNHVAGSPLLAYPRRKCHLRQAPGCVPPSSFLVRGTAAAGTNQFCLARSLSIALHMRGGCNGRGYQPVRHQKSSDANGVYHSMYMQMITTSACTKPLGALCAKVDACQPLRVRLHNPRCSTSDLLFARVAQHEQPRCCAGVGVGFLTYVNTENAACLLGQSANVPRNLQACTPPVPTRGLTHPSPAYAWCLAMCVCAVASV